MRFDPANSPTNCLLWCQSQRYIYAGLQDGDQCWCGTGIDVTKETPPTRKQNAIYRARAIS